MYFDHVSLNMTKNGFPNKRKTIIRIYLSGYKRYP